MAKRGRPKGSTYPDGPYLDQIADALTRDTTKSANSAIMAIAGKLGITDYNAQEAFHRRLHDKWSKQKEERMAEARERHAENNRPAQRVVKRTPSTLDVLRSVEEFPTMKLAPVWENLPYVRLQKLYDDLPYMRIQKMLDDMPALSLQRVLNKPYP